MAINSFFQSYLCIYRDCVIMISTSVHKNKYLDVVICTNVHKDNYQDVIKRGTENDNIMHI